MSAVKPKILYFIEGSVQTPAEIAEAGEISHVAHVRIRNVQLVGVHDTKEQADGVAGKVPEAYKDYPTAQQAIEAHLKVLEDKRKAAQDKVDQTEDSDAKQADEDGKGAAKETPEQTAKASAKMAKDVGEQTAKAEPAKSPWGGTEEKATKGKK